MRRCRLCLRVPEGDSIIGPAGTLASLLLKTHPMELATRLADALGDRYSLERELGRGGMASVWLALDHRHQRRVAVKVMHPELAESVAPERFAREVRVAAGLHHPNILPVFDSGVTPAREGAPALLWYTMPYVEGESLRQKLEREGQLSLAEALRVAREIAQALAHAHSRDILHRDVKPENILLGSAASLLSDFGIARVLEAADETALTQTGIRMGTPAYMSPEQAIGGIVDARSDVYSLGCVLYEMLAGEAPHTGPNSQAIIAKRILDPAPPVERCRPGLPPLVRTLVRRALAPVAADRFSSAADLARAIEHAQATDTVEVESVPVPSRTPQWRWTAGLVLAGIAASGGWMALANAGDRTASTRVEVPDSLSTNAEANAAYRRAVSYVDQVGSSSAPPGLLDGAIALFERAIELDPEFVVARVRLARAHDVAGLISGDTTRLQMAARQLESLGRTHPEVPEVLIALGRIHQRRAGGLAAAEAYYRRAAVLRPADATILGDLAYVQAVQADSAALETGARAVALSPYDPRMLRSVIIATSVFRNFDQLEAYTERLMAVEPGEIIGYSHKALVQIAARGDAEGAVKTLELAERRTGPASMHVAWVYAKAGPPGWRRWKRLSLDDMVGPTGFDSIRYYWFHALIADAEGRQAVSRVYADSILTAYPSGARSREYAYWLAIGAYARALQGDHAGSRRQLAEAEALRRDMPANAQAMFQTAFISTYAQLGDIDRAVAATRWLLEEPALYTRRSVRLSPEFHRLQNHPQFLQLLADTTLP